MHWWGHSWYTRVALNAGLGAMADDIKQSQRVVATLPAGIYQKLESVADQEGRPVGSLAGAIIEAWVRREEEKRYSSGEEFLSPLVDKLVMAMESRLKSSPKQDDQDSALKLIQALELASETFRPVLNVNQTCWDLGLRYGDGLQEEEFLRQIIRAGRYAPVVIPTIFNLLGPVPPKETLFNGKSPRAIYLEQIRRLRGIDMFTQEWVDCCIDAIDRSIIYTELPEHDELDVPF
jgi:hypothetical protein